MGASAYGTGKKNTKMSLERFVRYPNKLKKMQKQKKYIKNSS